jgi:hypothetical protein
MANKIFCCLLLLAALQNIAQKQRKLAKNI